MSGERVLEVPEEFIPFSREFAKCVIEYAPDDIIGFARGYFTAMCDGELDAFLVEQKETSKNFTFADALDFAEARSELINEIFKDYDVKEQGYLTLSVLVRIGQIFQPELSASSLQQKFNLPSADGDLKLASEDFAGYALESFLTTGHPTDYETELKIVMVGRDFIVSTASSAADKVDSNFPDQTDWDINLLTQAGSLAGVQRLLEAKAEVNQVDEFGFSPLKLAVSYGHQALTQHLVSAGAIVSADIIKKSFSEPIKDILTKDNTKKAADEHLIRRGLVIMDVQHSYTDASGSLAVENPAGLITTLNTIRTQTNWTFVALTKDEHPADHVSFASTHTRLSKKDKTPEELKEIQDIPKFSEITNPADNKPIFLWPDHCVIGTPGVEIAAQLDTKDNDVVIIKGARPGVDSISAFAEEDSTSSGLLAKCREHAIQELFITGNLLENGVARTALDAVKFGLKVVILQDATRSILTESVADVLNNLKNNGIEVVDSQDYQF